MGAAVTTLDLSYPETSWPWGIYTYGLSSYSPTPLLMVCYYSKYMRLHIVLLELATSHTLPLGPVRRHPPFH